MFVGEVCRFYGWSVNECLKMPARRFFAMHGAAKKLRAIEMVNQVDIASLPMFTAERYEQVRQAFASAGLQESRIEEKQQEAAPVEGANLKNALLGAFRR